MLQPDFSQVERRHAADQVEITGTANSIDAFFRNNLERVDDDLTLTATKQNRMHVRLFCAGSQQHGLAFHSAHPSREPNGVRSVERPRHAGKVITIPDAAIDRQLIRQWSEYIVLVGIHCPVLTGSLIAPEFRPFRLLLLDGFAVEPNI
jgi:hypothetical protein